MADVWRGTLTPGRALDLLNELPAGSRLAASVLGDRSAAGWDVRTHLLADLVESVQLAAWMTARTHSRKPLPPPERLPRPGRRAAAPATPRALDLSRHPGALPLPAKYRTTPT